MAPPAFVSSFKRRVGSAFFSDLPHPKEFDRDELMKLDVLEQAMDAGIEVGQAHHHFKALKKAIEKEEDLLGALRWGMETGQLPEAGEGGRAVEGWVLTKGQIDKRLKQRDEWLAGERKFLDNGHKTLVVFNFAIFVLAVAAAGSKIPTKGKGVVWLWRLNEALLVAAPLCVCLVRVVMKPLIALFLIMVGALLADMILMTELLFRG